LCTSLFTIFKVGIALLSLSEYVLTAMASGYVVLASYLSDIGFLADNLVLFLGISMFWFLVLNYVGFDFAVFLCYHVVLQLFYAFFLSISRMRVCWHIVVVYSFVIFCYISICGLSCFYIIMAATWVQGCTMEAVRW